MLLVRILSLNINFIFLQSPKPKTGIFCFLIHEARPATELELPGGENVFVIKVCIEYIHVQVPGKSQLSQDYSHL